MTGVLDVKEFGETEILAALEGESLLMKGSGFKILSVDLKENLPRCNTAAGSEVFGKNSLSSGCFGRNFDFMRLFRAGRSDLSASGARKRCRKRRAENGAASRGGAFGGRFHGIDGGVVFRRQAVARRTFVAHGGSGLYSFPVKNASLMPPLGCCLAKNSLFSENAY